MASSSALQGAWPRHLAEAAVIIASILLALGVDEWREERTDRELEREYLLRLLDDFEENTNISAVQRRQDSRKVRHARTIYPFVARGESDGLSQTTIVTSSYSATPSGTPIWARDTFEELKSTGRLGLIQNTDIRRELLAYYQYLEAEAHPYRLMSTAYRDSIRSRMDPDLQLRIRNTCNVEGDLEYGFSSADADCQIDVSSPDLDQYIDWLSSNQELADGLRRVILQWTRAETEYLPVVEDRTRQLRLLIEEELAK